MKLTVTMIIAVLFVTSCRIDTKSNKLNSQDSTTKVNGADIKYDSVKHLIKQEPKVKQSFINYNDRAPLQQGSRIKQLQGQGDWIKVKV